ncbi:hypothetical protein HO173_012169 [Letharia columbiana]|uniref:AAA+ ATPase domain-containing protein n=1 Tax=Letharia columbiana TaxID=112416 RepID=A0A8H6CQ35_9LECA|nr:uncharacterized protein HO173_012169 [Letharia columbiana]KAF6227530.1 hypothetical protein HO173_012169 [Letharia columbiana]
MTLPEKRRRGEQSDEGNQAKKPLHSFESTSQLGQASSMSSKEVQLPDLVPYDVVEDLTLVLPSQPLDVSAGFSKQRYARDLWTIFSEEAFVDRRLADMHKAWFEVRKPDARELWESRYPSGEAAGPSNKASNRHGVLRTVRTLELVIDRVSARQMPALHKSLSRLHLDYIMLMCVVCERSKYLDKARQYFPRYEEQFDELVQLLRSSTPELQGNSSVSSSNAPSLSWIPAETKSMIEGLIVDPKTVKTLDKIAGCEAAKAAIEAAAYIPSQWPHLLNEGYGCKNMLFHGSPGTGKSTLALALAAESKLPVYNVSSSHLVDKWVGSSEKNARALFETAASNAPSVIVFDEADAICRARRSGSNDGAQRMINELLACMTKYPKVVVIGITNLPWTLDVGFVRRFPKHVHVGLPLEKERREIFWIVLGRFPHSLSREHVIGAATQADGFTGDAIQRCIESAAETMAMKLRGVTHFQITEFRGQECYSPCDDGGIPVENIPGRHLVIPGPLSPQDLFSAIQKMKSELDLMGIEEEKHVRWGRNKFLDAN